MGQDDNSRLDDEQNSENKVSVSVTIDEEFAKRTEGPEVNRSGVINKALREFFSEQDEPFDGYRAKKKAWEESRHLFGTDIGYEETREYEQLSNASSESKEESQRCVGTNGQGNRCGVLTDDDSGFCLKHSHQEEPHPDTVDDSNKGDSA